MVATEQLESTRLLADGIRAFLQRVVAPLQQEHTAVLENSRRLYDEDGRYAREVRELMRSVRARSSAAGYYTAFVPEVLGGGGLGYYPQYEGWRALFAEALDAGGPAVQKAAIAKAFVTESCWRTYDRAMQVFGGMGLTNEVRLYHGLNAARIIRIADGTSEILRRTIARGVFKGELPL